MDSLLGLTPLLLMQIACAFFVYGISRRIGLNTALWTVLSCVPLLGLIVIYYVGYKFAFYIADSLNNIQQQLGIKKQ